MFFYVRNVSLQQNFVFLYRVLKHTMTLLSSTARVLCVSPILQYGMTQLDSYSQLRDDDDDDDFKY